MTATVTYPTSGITTQLAGKATLTFTHKPTIVFIAGNYYSTAAAVPYGGSIYSCCTEHTYTSSTDAINNNLSMIALAGAWSSTSVTFTLSNTFAGSNATTSMAAGFLHDGCKFISFYEL